ncbi:golvesin C-terminal-like domain-containing protein [Fulvivirga sediminis]|uniref:T9SS type A sorting domain-containing protein n=1 Tax=Fulvivirga sediminis TaxID=2803949 RepID=A0A937F8H5_9BACT|nr:T9SS type A sorting domain-containing protein [Fulvivirga sediminis]MBL3656220.1 T9SS type A sorting domain-containing protein [Fulvivirga sediminis]
MKNCKNLKSVKVGLLLCVLFFVCSVAWGQGFTAKRTDYGVGYLEYLPPNYNPSKQYPVIIFLHGSGERGDGSPASLEKIKKNGIPKLIKNGADICVNVNGREQCFIVLCPQTNRWGYDREIMPFTRFAAESYPIDPNRIYVTGVSMGGKGSWQAGYNDEDDDNIFAAIAPVSADGDPNKVYKVAEREIPTWVFHGSRDNSIPLRTAEYMVSQLMDADPNPEPLMTIYDGGTHGGSTWDKAYNLGHTYQNPNIYEWFLSHSLSGNGFEDPDDGGEDVVEVIVDDKSASFTSGWVNSTSGAEAKYKTTYRHDNNTNKGSQSATFSTSLEPGVYEVYGWWWEHSNRSSKTPFVISHAEGTSTVIQNQRRSGSRWTLLGTYTFGTSGRVVIGNANTDGYVVADAIKFKKIGDADPGDGETGNAVIVDNSDNGFSRSGSWSLSRQGGDSKYADSYFHDNNSGKGNKTATFSASLAAGSYDVYGWWWNFDNRATNAPFTIRHANGVSTVTKNQRTEGAKWVRLGTYNFNGASTVTLSNANTNGYVVADAIKFVPTGSVGDGDVVDNSPNQEVIDNQSGKFSRSGSWSWSDAGDSKYGNNYFHDGNGNKGQTKAEFKTRLSGTYQVYGWWFAFENRATNVPFDIIHAGGKSTIYKNQSINGGKWVSLGTYQFNGDAQVVIRNNHTNGYVVADAVKFVKVSSNNSRIASDEPALEVASELESTDKSSLYPNPANDILHVKVKTDLNDFTVQLMDISGRVYLDKAFSKSAGESEEVTIDLHAYSNVPKGINLVRVLSEEGAETLKFIYK